MSHMPESKHTQEIEMLKQQVHDMQRELQEIKRGPERNMYRQKGVLHLHQFMLYLMWCFSMLTGVVVSLILLSPGLNIHPIGIFMPTIIGITGPALIARPLNHFFLRRSRKQNRMIAGIFLALIVIVIGIIIRIWTNGSII